MARDQAPLLPATVRLRARPYLCDDAGGDWAEVPTTWTADADLADAGLGPAVGVGVGTATVRDSAHAIFDAAGAGPANSGALDALAKVVARDLWGWRLAAFDRAYAGIVAPAPDATVGAVTWSYRAGGASTRMATEPTGGEPTRLGHDDAASDCPNCTPVYPSPASVSGGTVTLPRKLLCLERGRLVEKPLGADSFAGCCGPPPTCRNYVAYVANTKGEPQAGVAVRFFGAGQVLLGSGATDGSGQATLANDPAKPFVVLSVVATLPDPCTDPTRTVTNQGGSRQVDANYPDPPTWPAGTCAFTFTVCRTRATLTTVDGATGAPLGGVALAGNNPVDGGSCDTAPPADCPGATWPSAPCSSVSDQQEGITVEGPDHVATGIAMVAGLHAGAVPPQDPPGIHGSDGTGGSNSWGNACVAGTGCLGGYWGGTAAVCSPCDGSATGTLLLFSKADWVYNPRCNGGPYNDRGMVLPRQICLSTTNFSPTAVGAAADGEVTLHWDPASWDGDPAARVDPCSGSDNALVWVANLSGGGTGQSVLDCGGAVQDYRPYDSVCVRFRLAGNCIASGQPPQATLAIEGTHDGACPTADERGEVVVTCPDANGNPAPHYPRPYASPVGTAYPWNACAQDPRGYTGSAPWSRSGSLSVDFTDAGGAATLVANYAGYAVCGQTSTQGPIACSVYECDGGGSPVNPYAASQARPPLAAAPGPSAARPGVREYLRLSAEVRACPHRTAPACGCPSVPGTCALGRGGDRGVTHADCVACRRDDAVTLVGHLNAFTGYGQQFVRLGRELEALGRPVRLAPLERDESFLPLDDWARSRAVTP